MNQKKTILFFLLTIATLILIGLIFIYSSSSVFALEKFGSAHYFVKKQVMGVLVGILGLMLFRAIPLAMIKRGSPLFFLGSLILTALTFVPGIGVAIHGSHRWIKLGPFGAQPSELLKIACILYLAYVLEKKEYQRNSFVHGYLPLLCILGITSLLLLAQPDFGQTVTLCATAFMLFFIAHVQTRFLLATFLAALPAVGVLILLKPYRFKRIITYLHPWDDPRGAGFQIIQSLIAVGSGRWFGVGIAQSKQKFFYLPMQHTDFIFSIIAEETGLIGSLCVILLYLAFLYLGMRLTKGLKSMFCTLTVLGCVILTTLQAYINMFVVTGLLPTKGISLPFVSYGNSSLVCALCMVGIILNCVKNDQESLYGA